MPRGHFFRQSDTEISYLNYTVFFVINIDVLSVHHSIKQCRKENQYNGLIAGNALSLLRERKKCASDAEMKPVECKTAR